MQQPVSARQAAIDIKLLFQYSLGIDPTKCHHPVPFEFGAGDNPLLEPRRRRLVHSRRPTRARSVTQPLNAVLFVAVMPLVSRRPAQPSQPRRFLMLHPLKHIRDHQNPLADPAAFAPCQAPQLCRSRFAAKKEYRHGPPTKRCSSVGSFYHILELPEAGIIIRISKLDPSAIRQRRAWGARTSRSFLL